MESQSGCPSSAAANRWERFKAVIERLYMVEKRKVSEVVTIMKNDHGFDAGENQYKYQFKKWKWKKNMLARKKTEIATQLQSRAAAGKPSSAITFQGRPIDQNKIRRHLKATARQESRDMVLKRAPLATGPDVLMVDSRPVLSFANSIFLKWNMPYAAMRRFQVQSFSHASPSSFSAPTPGSDIAVVTPSASADPPRDAPSPTALHLKEKVAIDRAHLFVQGQHDKLLKSMDKEERMEMSTWLYQYWFFCFKTAKNWGRGPRVWTADSLGFDRFHDPAHRSLPSTPSGGLNVDGPRPPEVLRPSNLCRWHIHVRQDEEEDYEELPEEEITADLAATADPYDESTWGPWPSQWQEPPLQARLRDALEHNDFSTIRTETLPVAVPQIAKAAKRSPDELLQESLGFSIISRDVDQVESILRQVQREKVDISSLHPCHLATSYLDGSKSCCNIFSALLHLGPSLRHIYTNDMGHTVLDNLMIAILKSHTSVTPTIADPALRDMCRFPGEEVDICGRWDADSDCIRHLLAKGDPSIPFSWKHKFCHTSVQAICHCICQISQYSTAMRGAASGLYVRRCFDCGMKLQLQPLHCLVVTAYHVACHGCEDEDLFGMVACLLCLIANGFDTRKMASISITALVQNAGLESPCDHEELSPAELSQKLSETPASSSWSAEVKTGWSVFCGILCLDQNNSEVIDSEGEMSEHSEVDDREFIGTDPPADFFRGDHFGFHNQAGLFRLREDLATLWAAVQAELSTYRRLDERYGWTSDYFSMEQLRDQLDRGEHVSVKYADAGLLQTHCVCGSFSTYRGIPTLSDTTTQYIANLDVWQRATYSHLPDY